MHMVSDCAQHKSLTKERPATEALVHNPFLDNGAIRVGLSPQMTSSK
jgi:hypothetical protein